MYVALYGIIALIIIFALIPMSTSIIAALGIIFTVILIIAVVKRNFDKKDIKEYSEDALIIQNVKAGGVIKLANVDGYDTDLELKVIARNLYMEGDYSWYELECVRNDGEKVWVDVDDDDDLQVSVVLRKVRYGSLKLSDTLDNMYEEDMGSVYFEDKKFNYVDAGDAKFYKHCDDKKVEKLRYFDFKAGVKYIISIEQWDNAEGKDAIECFLSQIIKPASITVYSTKGNV